MLQFPIELLLIGWAGVPPVSTVLVFPYLQLLLSALQIIPGSW